MQVGAETVFAYAHTPNTVELIPTLGTLSPPRRVRPGPGPHKHLQRQEVAPTPASSATAPTSGAKACLLIRKHGRFTPTREIKRHVRALARNHPEGWKLQGTPRPLRRECIGSNASVQKWPQRVQQTPPYHSCLLTTFPALFLPGGPPPPAQTLAGTGKIRWYKCSSFSALLLSSLELSDSKVYEP